MSNNRIIIVSMLLIFCFPVLGAEDFILKNPSASGLLDKYRENQSKMTKILVFSESSEETGSSNNGDKRFFKAKSELRYDGDRVDFRFSTWSDLDNLDVNIDSKEATYYKYYIWDGNTSYEYRRGKTTEKGKLFVTKNDDMKGPQLAVSYDDAPLLGIYQGDDLPVGTVLQKATKLELRKNMEQVGNFKCYAIDALSPYGKYAIWIDPAHGYNIAKAEVTKGGKDLVWNGETLLRENRAGVMTAISFSYEVDRFEKINDVWVPMEAKHNYKRDYQNAAFDYTYLKTHNKRTKVVLNPDFEKIGAFVHDVQEGDEIYNVEDNLSTNKTEQPASLVGKTLPELQNFKIESMPDSTNKIVLVCFFDIEQRPSRNGIIELSKKAKELKKKDIEVIAIQASTIEQEYLDKWLKENSIDFPLGMIKDNPEQIKFNWGVKALPWLILTDKEHVVQAEGFSVNELEEKVKQ
ncbi:MAG: redoxin domain-containing protein [Sedimentisphaerales bacterium]|nr:redoxin domain-containing protein [Sedimentisphaerales bacterium]